MVIRFVEAIKRRRRRWITPQLLVFLPLVSGWAQAQLPLSILDGRPNAVQIDPNGFPLNPKWLNGAIRPDIEGACRFRVSSGELDRRTLVVTRPNCLSSLERDEVTINEAGGTLGVGFICGTSSIIGNLRGHVNWFPVTISGLMHWEGYSSGAGDHDLTFELQPVEPNALTTGNEQDFDGRGAYHIEFYHGETIARLPAGAFGWWPALNAAMSSGKRDSIAGSLVEKRLAIATGTYGLDGVHSLQAELHPVYAMAVLVDTSQTANGVTERWALMVRNRGSEGDCSEGEVPFYSTPKAVEQQHYVLDLGWLSGANSAQVTLESGWSTESTAHVDARSVVGQHLYIDVPHRRPILNEPDFLLVGTISVSWTGNYGNYANARIPALLGAADSRVRIDKASAAQSVAQQILHLTPFVERASDLWKLPADLAGRIQRDAINRYQRLTPIPVGAARPVDPMWSAAAAPFSYASTQWMIRQPIAIENCKADGNVADRLCRGRWRWAIGESRTVDGEWAPMASYFLFAHSWAWHGKASTLGDVLGGFAYRFEARRDVYRKEIDGEKVRFSGGSLRITPILAPNSFRLSSNLTLAPYSLISTGLSFLDGAKPAPTISTGAGMHFLLRRTDLFTEVQRFSRANKYDGYYDIAVGMMLPPAIFK